MKFGKLLLVLYPFLSILPAAEWKENEYGVVGYDDTPRLPWTEFRKHDSSRPHPQAVSAEPLLAVAPEDAVVLFRGFDRDAWQPNAWTIRNGILIAGEGDLLSKESFGDCQIHLEFRTPKKVSGDLGNRGNSGVFPMGLYEIQIFDSYPGHARKLYPDGMCAAIYGETPPAKNACRAPGKWQSFDIFFTAPRFDDAGALIEPARVTVLHNGLVVHLDAVIHGPTTHREILDYKPHAAELPLKLQGHGSAVEFRNIWVRRL